jgi:hypothetical protein
MSDATRCPLCGETNECGIAAGQSTCWCFSTSIPADVLERIPEEARGTACVCAKCAATSSPQAMAPSRHESGS